MKFLNINIRDIIKDVIISLIVFFIIGLLSKLKAALPIAGNNIIHIISSIIISEASRRIGLSLFDIFCMIISLPLLLILVIIYSISFYNWWQDNKKLKHFLKNYNETESSADLYEKNKIRINNNRNKMIGNIIAVVIFIICLANFSFTSYIPAALRHSYEIEIKRITPYTTTEVIQKLESDWTLMKTEKDFEKIHSTIDEIKNKNNLNKVR